MSPYPASSHFLTMQTTKMNGTSLFICMNAQVRHLIEDFWKDIHLQNGYQLLYTPHIAKVGRQLFVCFTENPDPELAALPQNFGHKLITPLLFPGGPLEDQWAH